MEELCKDTFSEMKEIGVDLGDPKGDKSAKYIIDTKTLEVKEVDLETEINKWRHNHFHGRRDKNASGEYLERISQLELAKHFFELGLKAQKGNKNEIDYDEELKKCKANPLYFFDKYVKVKLKEQKPAWSEEDERIYRSITYSFSHNFPLTIQQQKFVKSIKDRYTWKPSEEMLEALYRVIPENAMEKSEDEILLDKLYQGLKYGKVLSEK